MKGEVKWSAAVTTSSSPLGALPASLVHTVNVLALHFPRMV